MPLPWALVFGALISPTDPVAVLATLKEVKVPSDLQTLMTGETLFNDGVGVVLFTVLVQAAAGGSIEPMHIGEMFLLEALGGAALSVDVTSPRANWVGIGSRPSACSNVSPLRLPISASSLVDTAPISYECNGLAV